jgi:hypothetical protein
MSTGRSANDKRSGPPKGVAWAKVKPGAQREVRIGQGRNYR